MSKNIKLLLSLTLALLLIGCGDKETSIKAEKEVNFDEPQEENISNNIEFEFSYDPDTMTAIGIASECSGNIDVVEVPSEVEYDGEKFTVVELDAVFSNKEGIKKVIIPETVKKLSKTFYFSDVEEVEIRGTISEVDDDTFNNCTKLKSLSFKEGLEKVGIEGIFYCKNLKEIHLPASLKGTEKEFDQHIWLDSLSEDLVVYTPSGSDVEAYAKSLGITVVNE